MTIRKGRGSLPGLVLLARPGLVLIASVLLSGAQPTLSLRIVSPSSNVVVRPGRRLAVTVFAEGTFETVGVSAGGPLSEGFLGVDVIEPKPGHSRVYTFSIQIPKNADPGLYYLTAAATTASGAMFDSDPVSIDVEPADVPPVTLEPSAITIQVGSSQMLSACSRYADGTEVNLNGSSRINFVSQAPDIAGVDRDGKVVGRSAGSTKIVVFGKYTVNVTVLDRKF